MNHIKIEKHSEPPSDDEVVIVAISTNVDGKELITFPISKQTNDELFIAKGPLVVTENQRLIPDEKEEDPTPIEGEPSQEIPAKGTRRKVSVTKKKREALPTDFKMNHHGLQVVAPADTSVGTSEILVHNFARYFKKFTDKLCAKHTTPTKAVCIKYLFPVTFRFSDNFLLNFLH